MHNYIVFDHCQLFRQHTWPNFIFCHNIGIVKVSHKKLTSTFHTPPVCLRVPPLPPMDYLHNYIFFDHCQLFLQLFPQHRYLTRIHIMPQHRHCEGLPQKLTIFLLSVCTITICTITKSWPLPTFPQYTWPQFIFYHNIGIVKNFHIKILNLLSIPPPVCV